MAYFLAGWMADYSLGILLQMKTTARALRSADEAGAQQCCKRIRSRNGNGENY